MSAFLALMNKALANAISVANREKLKLPSEPEIHTFHLKAAENKVDNLGGTADLHYRDQGQEKENEVSVGLVPLLLICI